MVWQVAHLGLVWGLILLLGFIPFKVSADTAVKITFLDVGEGEATLVQAGDKVVLIDSGNVMSINTVLKHLSMHDIDTIDHLIITHPHLDHMSGVFHLLHSVAVKQRYDNGQTIHFSQGDMYRWYAEFYRKNNYRALTTSDQLTLPGLTLRVLNSAKGDRSWNTNSLVLSLECYDHRALLMGDATLETERDLLSNGSRLSADLIKIGHHGWTDASSVDFIKAVSPQYAVIAINENNIRGYPADVVVERLKSQQVTVLKTFQSGHIHFVCDNRGIHQVADTINEADTLLR